MLLAVSHLIQIYMFVNAQNSVSKRSFYFQLCTGSRMSCTGSHIRFHCARLDSRARGEKKVTLQKINKRRRRGSSGGGRQAPRILTFSKNKNKNIYIWDYAVCQEE